MPSSDIPGGQTGATLLEVMVVLLVLALGAGVAATGFQGPSPALQESRERANVLRSSSTARAKAIAMQQSVSLEIPRASCSAQGDDVALTFFPDGTAAPSEICIGSQRLRTNVLTGRVMRVE